MKRALRPVAILLPLLAGCGAPAGGGDGGSADAAVAEDLTVTPDIAIVGPGRLSETGLYSDSSARTIAPGVFHFTPRYPLWSDGADKDRWLWLPPGTTIDTSDMNQWAFPIGTRAWKEFRKDGRLVETRLLEKVREAAPDDPGGGWWEMAYAWRPDESDADAVPLGVKDARGTPHDVPAQTECDRCHGNVRDVLIGVSAIQLSAADGKGALSQLAAMGALSSPPPSEFEAPGQGVVKEALGYLHGNCGHCHSPASRLAKFVRLQMRLTTTDATPEATETYTTAILGLANHVVPPDVKYDVVPGMPEQSQLYVRMGLRDNWAMPPACTEFTDGDGLAAVRGWILSLPP